jgi:hypothetical protein
MMKSRTPIPNLGYCTRSMDWYDKSMITDCKKCIQSSNSNMKNFYCNGKCLNPYDENSRCSYSELVAKTETQCDKPCIQTGIPPVNGGCSDKFDCKEEEECMVIQNKGICRIPGMPFNNLFAGI